MVQSKNNISYLTCKRVIYYTLKDEDVFFEWIKKIKSINSFEGAGGELYLDLVSVTLPDDDLREILALFYRYKVDMKQLAEFLTEDNKHWFKEERTKGFWHKRVFGE